MASNNSNSPIGGNTTGNNRGGNRQKKNRNSSQTASDSQYQRREKFSDVDKVSYDKDETSSTSTETSSIEADDKVCSTSNHFRPLSIFVTLGCWD